MKVIAALAQNRLGTGVGAVKEPHTAGRLQSYAYLPGDNVPLNSNGFLF